MSDSLKRAEALVDTKRWDLALDELQEHLIEHPEDTQALSLAARCFVELKLYGKASEYADAAISAAPDYGYGHYLRAYILQLRNLDEDARAALDSALELEPANPDFHVMAARMHANKSEWTDALESADVALGFHPGHADAQVVRSQALTKLGRYEEARSNLEFVLENDPENEEALIQMGYLHLHQGDWKEALEAFQGALMLDPESEAARQGFMMALRSKYPFYGLMLKYSFWLHRFSKEHQRTIQYSLSVVATLIRHIQKEYPALRPVLSLLLLVYRVFAYFTWTVRAGTTLLLRLNKYGRSLVNRDEVAESNIVGALWSAAFLCFLYHNLIDPFTMFCRLGMPVFLSLPLIVAGAFSAPNYGWPKYVARGILAVMSFLALVGLVLYTFRSPTGASYIRFYFQSYPIVLLVLAHLESVEPERS